MSDPRPPLEAMHDYRNGTVLAGLLRRSRELRREQTDAEQLLWRLLRSRQIAGAKFRRQHALGPYILDFLCAEQRLAVELDGDQHAQPEQAGHDAERTRFLERHGLRVLRFSNREVLQDTEVVLRQLYTVLTGYPSP
ncbi:MAG TPA: endonuclease domain-containing protein [Aggregicoccus sp.]|nr:endonuclease domain-containing protein [Aggregicoccus sp.]